MQLFLNANVIYHSFCSLSEVNMKRDVWERTYPVLVQSRHHTCKYGKVARCNTQQSPNSIVPSFARFTLSLRYSLQHPTLTNLLHSTLSKRSPDVSAGLEIQVCRFTLERHSFSQCSCLDFSWCSSSLLLLYCPPSAVLA